MIDLTSFLDKYFANNNEPILVACSTGPDSMYLVHALLQTDFYDRVILLYFHHHLREEADEEVRFFQHFCQKYSLQYEIGHGDIPLLKKKMPSTSIEELARKKRYDFFSDMRAKYHASYTLTAHHADDRIETFFFHLLRGTKLTGLINMTEKSGNILRPLLGISKQKIMHDISYYKWEYMTDSSNTDNTFSRNRLRNVIFPHCTQIHSGWKKNIGNFIQYAENLQDFLSGQVQSFLEKHDGYFLVSDFEKESEFFQKEILSFLYTQCNGSSIWLSEANLGEMRKFVFSPYGGTFFELSNFRLEKKSGKIHWKTK